MQFSPELQDILGRIVIAVDGPAGSGKTTTAREVARRLGLRHIDTGAMYRAVTWKALAAGVDPKDEARVGGIAAKIEIAFSVGPSEIQRVSADGTDVTDAVRSLEVTQNVSLVSSYAGVRKTMVRLQRRLAAGGGAVLEGRDIGSVVLPAADVKVFLTASTEERARRRSIELEEKGVRMPLAEMRSEIERRDRLDSSREISPLKIPVGAHVIDTSELSIEGQVSQVVGIACETASFLLSRVVGRGEKDPRTRRRPSYRYSCLGIRILARVLFGLRIVGRRRTRFGENYIYACNHRSNLDPPIVGATLDREVHFMAKDKLFRSKLLSRIITHYNAISTRRDIFDRSAFRRAEDVLNRGGSLLIFPEGTRIQGDDLGRAKPGVGYLALQTGVPVVPIYLEGTQRLKACLLRRSRLQVVHGSPIRVQNREAWPPTADDCRELGDMIMAAIGALRDGMEMTGKL